LTPRSLTSWPTTPANGYEMQSGFGQLPGSIAFCLDLRSQRGRLCQEMACFDVGTLCWCRRTSKRAVKASQEQTACCCNYPAGLSSSAPQRLGGHACGNTAAFPATRAPATGSGELRGGCTQCDATKRRCQAVCAAGVKLAKIQHGVPKLVVAAVENSQACISG
jgi:hypothetical protein